MQILLILKVEAKANFTEPVFLNVYGAPESFQGMNSASLSSLAGRYDNPLPPRFLAPIDSLKFQLSILQ